MSLTLLKYSSQHALNQVVIENQMFKKLKNSFIIWYSILASILINVALDLILNPSRCSLTGTLHPSLSV